MNKLLILLAAFSLLFAEDNGEGRGRRGGRFNKGGLGVSEREEIWPPPPPSSSSEKRGKEGRREGVGCGEGEVLSLADGVIYNVPTFFHFPLFDSASSTPPHEKKKEKGRGLPPKKAQKADFVGRSLTQKCSRMCFFSGKKNVHYRHT